MRCGRPTRPTLFAADGARGDGGALVAAPRTAPVAVPLHSGHAERLAARRLARQLPAALAAQRRRRLRQAAQRAGQTPSQARRARAEWDAASTTVGPERLTVEEGVVLARVRWQIAPLCKLWQQHGLVAAWRRAQPWRMRGAVYANWLALLRQHRCWLRVTWADPRRSLVAAAQVVRDHALLLAKARGQATTRHAVRTALAANLAQAGQVVTRRRAPATADRRLALATLHEAVMTA